MRFWKIFRIGLFVTHLLSAVAFAVQGPKEVKIDALSRNFLNPSLEDFMRPDQGGFSFEEVHFQNLNGESLRAWFLPSDHSEKTILLCMGNTGNISNMLMYSKILHDGGFNVLLFDYQGFGGSTGTASVLSLLGDTQSAFDYLTNKRGIPPNKIGVFGISLGTPLAVAIAAERSVAAVAIEDSLLPTKRVEEFKKRLPNDAATKTALLMVQNLVLPKVDPLANAKKLKCPLLVIHGENDKLLPPMDSIELVKTSKAPTRLWIMQGAGHAPESMEINDREYASQIQDFFRSAFDDSIAEPVVKWKTAKKDENWISKITIESEHESASQVAIVGDDGRCHFHNCYVASSAVIEVPTTFMPIHISCIEMKHVKRLPNDQWEPDLSKLSQSLADFRLFERSVAMDCPLRQEMAMFFGRLRSMNFHNADDAGWMKDRLPNPESIHPHVRPRYALLLGAFFATLSPQDQPKHVDLVESALPFLPSNFEQFYRLENASFRLKFKDDTLADALILAAREKYLRNDIAATKGLLQTSLNIASSSWLKKESIDDLKLGPHEQFFQAIGSPYHR